jgi:hypothetical protein
LTLWGPLLAGNLSSVPRADFFRFLALGGVLFVFMLWVNGPVIEHRWVDFDDDINIVRNPNLTGLSGDSLAWAWTDAGYVRRYMPLGWMLFDGLFRLGGLEPAIYHAASSVLSAAGALVMFELVRRCVTGCVPGVGPRGRDVLAALTTALAFTHPLRAELVGWASGLLYLLSSLLAGGAMCVVLAPNANPVSRTRSWLAGALFLASLLVYPVCIFLPVLLVVIDVAIALARKPISWGAAAGQAVRRHWTWFAISGVVGVVNLAAAATATTFSPVAGVADYSLWERAIRANALLGHYLVRVVWPGITSPFYGQPTAFPALEQWAFPVAIVGLGLLAVLRRSWTRPVVLVGATFLAATLPFAGLLDQGQTGNDRYAFILLACGAVLLAVAGARLVARGAQITTAVALVALVAFLVPRYRAALAVWHDTESVQARIDRVTADHPDIRLSFARPAVREFLIGNYPASEARLRAGFRQFGEHPALVDAARLIEETRARLAPNGGNPPVPPAAVLHVELSHGHAAQGHALAASVHMAFAGRIAAAAPETDRPAP